MTGKSPQTKKEVRAYLRRRGRHGAPPIGGELISEGYKSKKYTQKGGNRLSKQEVYKEQKNAIKQKAVNPAGPLKRIREINNAREDAPPIKKFQLPDEWELQRTVRKIPTVDNLYYGPCGPKQNKPRLRSLTQVYKCLYTDDMKNKKFCLGNPVGPCEASTVKTRRARSPARVNLSDLEIPEDIGLDFGGKELADDVENNPEEAISKVDQLLGLSNADLSKFITPDEIDDLLNLFPIPVQPGVEENVMEVLSNVMGANGQPSDQRISELLPKEVTSLSNDLEELLRNPLDLLPF